MLSEKRKKLAAPKAIDVELSYLFITVIRGESSLSDNCQQTEKDNEDKKTQILTSMEACFHHK